MTKETLKSLLEASQGEGEIFELLALSGGEITQEIEERMEDISIALPAKVDRYYLFLENLESRMQKLTEHIEDLKKLKSSLEGVSERTSAFMMSQMISNGLTSLAGNSYRFRVSQCPMRTVIDDENLVAAKFKIIKTIQTIDKASVKLAIEAGESVAGAHLDGGECLKRYRNLLE